MAGGIPGLDVRYGPLTVFWKGLPLRLTPSCKSLLAFLAEHGRASFFALEMVGIGPDAGPKTLSVQLCHLRRVLERAGVSVEIRSIRGWGYELVQEQAAAR